MFKEILYPLIWKVYLCKRVHWYRSWLVIDNKIYSFTYFPPNLKLSSLLFKDVWFHWFGVIACFCKRNISFYLQIHLCFIVYISVISDVTSFLIV